LKVALTEVDIRIDLKGQQKPSQQDIDKKTQDYQKVYETCRQVKGCISVTTWGVTPDDSWVGNIQFQGKVLFKQA
jgi:GH35 family endo-1,4-beta-xylanase